MKNETFNKFTKFLFFFTGRKVEGDAPPVRLLDDLFRKTKATPCLYWLPLSAEQVTFTISNPPHHHFLSNFFSLRRSLKRKNSVRRTSPNTNVEWKKSERREKKECAKDAAQIRVIVVVTKVAIVVENLFHVTVDITDAKLF